MSVTDIIRAQGPVLDKKMAMYSKTPWMNGTAGLASLAEVESSYGSFAVPRYEKAYDLHGKYGSYHLWNKYGAHAACSYSSWQIMYPVAVELGFRGRPYDLNDDSVAILWVLELMDRRILQAGCASISQFCDAYNTGNFRDSIVPEEYIRKFELSYQDVIQRRGL